MFAVHIGPKSPPLGMQSTTGIVNEVYPNSNDMQVDLQPEIQLQDESELHPMLNGPRSSGIATVDQSEASKLFEDAVVTDASSQLSISTFYLVTT